jgi:6-phosphogluconolactonase
VIAEFDPLSGALTKQLEGLPLTNPSYVISGAGGLLYVVSERFNGPGMVHALARSGTKIGVRWQVSSRGRCSCHLAVLPGGDVLAVSHYLGGSISLFSTHDGTLLGETHYVGRGPYAQRQSESHPHQCVASPSGRWLLVPDLGADRVWAHPISNRLGVLEPAGTTALPGTGPRHLVFHPCGTRVSVFGELDGHVHTGRWVEDLGQITWIQSMRTVPEIAAPEASGSAIKLHPSLPLIYAANRSLHDLAVLAVETNGSLSERGRIQAGGTTPRDFTISRDGRWLLVACQNSHRIVAYPLNEANGLPSGPSITALETGSPVCLAWITH